jgi:hypothetical protein
MQSFWRSPAPRTKISLHLTPMRLSCGPLTALLILGLSGCTTIPSLAALQGAPLPKASRGLLSGDQIAPAPSPSQASFRVDKLAFKQTSKDQRCLIEIQYPQVQGLRTREVDEQINTVLFKAFLSTPGRSLDPEQCADEKQQFPEIKAIYGWYSDFDVTLNNSEALSIHGYASLTPGAHPQEIIKTYTFDAKTGQLLRLQDLFSPGVDYRSRLNAAIPKKIAATLNADPERQFTPTEIESIVQSFQPRQDYQFYLDPNQGLVIVDVFEVHALRAISVNFSAEEVKDWVDSDSPLYFLLEKD